MQFNEFIDIAGDGDGHLTYLIDRGSPEYGNLIHEIRRENNCGKIRAEEFLSEDIRREISTEFPGIPIVDHFVDEFTEQKDLFYLFGVTKPELLDKNRLTKKKHAYAEYLRHRLHEFQNFDLAELQELPDDFVLDSYRFNAETKQEMYSVEWQDFCIFYSHGSSIAHRWIAFGIECSKCGRCKLKKEGLTAKN